MLKGFKAIYALIMASGKGSRMGIDIPKQMLPYKGSTVLDTSVRAFYERSDVDAVIVTSPSDASLDSAYEDIATKIQGAAQKQIRIARGGARRSDSVCAGLALAQKMAEETDLDASEVLVMIHDAARPGISQDIIDRCIEAMQSSEAVTAALPASDSVRIAIDEAADEITHNALKDAATYPIISSACVDRNLVFLVQTPQCFRLSDIAEAHQKAATDGFADRATDDASVAEHAGIKLAIVKGSAANSKITTKEDLNMSIRIGQGYDVHRLVPERDLILCGTPIPANLGLLGHSDADVATHALMDALLGAAGLGDIGRHFPDTDEQYRGADSMKLLAKVKEMLGDAAIVNVDITIIAQEPKLAPYIKQMESNIAKTLEIAESAVNVKATTEEGLGFTGRGEGIAATAVCSIEGSI